MFVKIRQKLCAKWQKALQQLESVEKKQFEIRWLQTIYSQMDFHAEVNSQTKWKIKLDFSEQTSWTAYVKYRAPFWEFASGT